MSKSKLKVGKKKKLYEGKWLDVWATEFVDGAGSKKKWEWIDKFDVVAVLPITSDNKAVLIKSYRVPLEKYVIETPAGLVDKAGESLEKAARRELLEETGYRARKLVRLPPWPYKSTTSRNIIYAFVATGLKKVCEEVGDATEDISVIEVPLKKLASFWLNLPRDTYFQPEILGMYQMAIHLGICE